MSGGALRKQEGHCKELPHSVRRADIMLIFGCLFVAFMTGLFLAIHSKAGSTVCISCDGREILQFELNDVNHNGQNKYYLIRYTAQDNAHAEVSTAMAKEFSVEAEVMVYENKPELPETGSYNLISVSDGRVTMEAADCRDQICVRHKPVSSDRESIICLPHKLVVAITDGERAKGMLREQKNGEDSPDIKGEQLDGVTR